MADLTDVDSALIAKIDGFRRSRNLAELASCTRYFDWAYHSVDDLRALKQIEAFFKKNSLFSNSDVCSAAAEKSFMDSEAQCRETNDQLDFYYTQRQLLAADLSFWISRMERYISNVLGPFDRFLDELPSLVRVTPGATAQQSRRNSLPQLKMRLKLFSTRGAKNYLSALYRYHGFNAPKVTETTTNRVELVPKNWKTSRTIACEPEGNLPLQLAFDSYAKRRLRRFGIDLSNQEANRKAARKGSIDGSLATIDFSAASDTISFNAVAWLIPWDWFAYLCRVRSPQYRGVFGNGTYAKFSSMGNGSTFTIETLLFAAACYAVGSKQFLVYGDDVIIESELVENYTRLTRFLGFTINSDKSFATGPFRESCGLDVYNGIEITPVYIRNLDSRKAVKNHLINTMASIALPDGRLAEYLLALIKEWKLHCTPYQENTFSGVWIDPEKARALGTLKHKCFLHFSRSFIPRSKERKFVDSRGYYLWFLNKNSQVLFAGPWALARNCTYDETSSVPIFEHRYVRKWVVWQLPDGGIPDHLYWWSEQVYNAFNKP
jgi:hypothetical protein